MEKSSLQLRYCAFLTIFQCLFSIVLMAISSITLFAQQEVKDSLIHVVGHAYNLESKEPIKARITYEKLPNGDDYGIANTNDSGEFDLVLINKHRYSLIVKAEGYLTFKETILLEDSLGNDSSVVHKNFFLTPGGVGHLIRIKSLQFEQSASEIPADAMEEIHAIVKMLRENPKMVIQLEGHTDFRGNSKLNLQLSEERVETIRNYIAKNGIDKKRIRVKAFGGSMPLSKESSEEARKANRRVEVRVLEI